MSAARQGAVIEWGFYSEAHWALAILGVEAMSEEDARSLNPRLVGHDHPWRVAVHEASHGLACLLESTEFESLRLDPGCLVFDMNQPPAEDYEEPPFAARVAVDAAGMLGEEILFGQAGANGGAVDVGRVLARFEIKVTSVDPQRVHEARAHVTRARQMLSGERELLVTLATALLTAGRLTRD